MDALKNGRAGRYIKYAIIVLAVLLILLGVFFVREYWTLRREQLINARELWLTSVFIHHGTPTVNDVSIVRSWMTFDYVNKLFNLPSHYLQTRLSITDTRYPRLSISSYAATAHLDTNIVMTEVESAVRDYLTVGTT